MKHRSLILGPHLDPPINALCRALLVLQTIPELRAFMRDLCTPSELEALADRWRVVPFLLDGLAYREIHDRTKVSVTTIGRVARSLSQGHGGYRAALRRTSDSMAQMAQLQARKSNRPRSASVKTGAGE